MNRPCARVTTSWLTPALDHAIIVEILHHLPPTLANPFDLSGFKSPLHLCSHICIHPLHISVLILLASKSTTLSLCLTLPSSLPLPSCGFLTSLLLLTNPTILGVPSHPNTSMTSHWARLSAHMLFECLYPPGSYFFHILR